MVWAAADASKKATVVELDAPSLARWDVSPFWILKRSPSSGQKTICSCVVVREDQICREQEIHVAAAE